MNYIDDEDNEDIPLSRQERVPQRPQKNLDRYIENSKEKNKLLKFRDFMFNHARQGNLYIDPSVIPEGRQYKWFAQAVNGYKILEFEQKEQYGWSEVPADRHNFPVRVGDQILCERPIEYQLIEKEAYRHQYLTRMKNHLKQGSIKKEQVLGNQNIVGQNKY